MQPHDEEDHRALPDDPLWFKDAIIYEIPVRAFYDSNADGVGDFQGLIEKLDYVQDLGVTAIWILPFYPSPLRDGGYDIADYRTVSPAFGDLKDFKRFLREAHRRGIRVITELVINHTSDQHPWFQRARRSPAGSRYRDFYVWSDDPRRYADARIIFQDYEASNWTWDPIAQAYYWHRFYSHQPDLNFDNPEVRRAVLGLCDFWLELGVDGMRLDAIPYLYEREGTNCENLPETHAFLRELRAHIDARFPNRMLLAEANQWPEDAAEYFGQGDECHMNFHFPLMPRMFMALQLESSFPILDILQQTPEIPENCQWAVFLRNHDELTLEMVTDEDRDFMYRVYAEDPQMRVNLGIRRRLAPLMRTRSRVELMKALLLSMPGTPVLYYGDEVGMGDNIYLGDRDAVRTPMQWTGERNAGFSRANPQKLYLPTIIDPEYHHGTVNVEAQQNNPESLLWWTKHLIALRKQHRVFGRGALELLHPENGKVLAFFRHDAHERILVVANLSRFSQYVELDLSAHVGATPVELFGGASFPRIGELPYLLTLGPYGFYWFLLKPPVDVGEEEALPRWSMRASWPLLLEGRGRARLERALAGWMRHRRWFRGKGRKLKNVAVRDALAAGSARIALVEARYVEGDPELYSVPLDLAFGERAEQLRRGAPTSLIAEIETPSDGVGVLHDATASELFAEQLLSMFLERQTLRGPHGVVRGRATRALGELLDRDLTAHAGRERRRTELPPQVGTAEQSNTNLIYGDRLILKLFRVLEEGEHPEEEVGRFLTDRARFAHVPRLAGSLTYEPKRGTPRAFAVLQQFVQSQGDAWTTTIDAVLRYFESTTWESVEEHPAPLDHHTLPERARREVPELAREAIGAYLGLARVLGQRTAELHRALASELEHPDFAPVPFSLLHQRSLYQSARGLLGPTFAKLRRHLDAMPADTRALAQAVLDRRADVDARLRRIHRHKIEAARVRTHGDFHLGQVLVAAGDFLFIDFEGEPARPLAERRRKRSPLRDVAGLLRSFDYAAAAALRSERLRPEDAVRLVPWARAWAQWVGAACLDGWRQGAEGAVFLPADDESFTTLLEFHLLEKCIYEIGYELDNRPDWLPIPLRGLLDLLDVEAP
jgi:maltose alpha-D-glucosyltransferase/alpha-amylase